MSDRSDELKAALLNHIGQMQDDNLRIVLLLIHGTFEQSLAEIAAIGKKIDELKTDEEALQHAVLNGLAPHHKSDHEWIVEHRKMTETTMPIITRAAPCLTWVEEKMAAEKEAAKTRKGLVLRGLEGAAGQIGTIVATAIATWAAVTFFK